MKNNIIEVKHLTKRFGKQNAVDDVSFEVEEGKIFALLGSNGAGKTTIVNMLTTLMPPTAGEVLIGSHRLGSADAVIRDMISVTGQFASLDENLTGMENMQIIGALNHLDKGALNQRISELLDQFQLLEAAQKIVKSYSGGMKRRLDIAASLIREPKILFLDEPTTGIDPENRIELWKYIKRLANEKGMTIFLTTQYMEEAECLADFVAIMNDGSLIKSGTLNQIKGLLNTSKIQIELQHQLQIEQQAWFENHQFIKRDELIFEVVTKDKIQTLNELLNFSATTQLEVKDMKISDATLEDVYLNTIKERVK